ncbi:MAG: type II toxin-antitoxin system RelE/ParE family toxin [Verrucomicrobiales bacterium]|nr:type II toxin-antitoxin system RelE/ParE family toxin [Verrucomicrobiales bacterium]
MKLSLQRADEFNADFEQQYRWYADQAGEEIAERFLRAVADTLPRLAALPDLGRRRKFRHPMLRDLYSFQVERPFNKILIFYRVTGSTLQAWRLMHGSRDLPRRLVEPPED